MEIDQSDHSEDEFCERIREQLLHKQITLLDFVQSLGPQLQSTDPLERESALENLIQVVLRLPPDLFSEAEVVHLTDFLCGKLSDSTLLTAPIIKAVHFLVSNTRNLPEKSVVSVVRSLIKEQQVQSWPAQDRFLIFQILNHFLGQRITVLREMGPEFIMSFMQAIEGEQDPRCLLMVFRCFCEVVLKMSTCVDTFSSDLFELVACYFPVDFKPPENDPYGITREQLCVYLRRCLTCSSGFADLCLDMLAENLSGTEDMDQHSCDECFRLLLSAYDRFPAAAVCRYAVGLWGGMRNRAFAANAYGQFQSQLTQPFRDAIRGLFATVEKTTQDGMNSQLTSLVDRAVNDCEPFLLNHEMGLCGRVCEVLRPVALVSPSVCARLCSKILVRVLDFASNDSAALPLLANFCSMAAQMNAAERSIPIGCRPQLSSLLSGKYLKNRLALKSDKLQSAVDLGHALTMAGVQWDLVEKFELVKVGGTALPHAVDDDIKRSACISLVRTIFGQLSTDERGQLLADLDLTASIHSMTLLAIAIHDMDSAQTLLPLLIEYLHKTPVDAFDVMVLTVLDLFKWNKDSHDVLDFCWKPVVSCLLSLVADLGLHPDCRGPLSVSLQEIFIDLPEPSASQCLEVLVKSLLQTKFLPKFVASCFLLFRSVWPEDAMPLLDSTGDRLFATLDKEEEIADISYQILCSFLNKLPPSESDRFNALFARLERYSLQNETCVRTARLCRACLLRNEQPHADDSLRRYFSLLLDDQTSVCAVQNVNLLFAGFDPVPWSVERTRMRVSLLYRQRLFSQCMTAFLHAYNLASLDRRNYFFGALGEMLKYAPVDGLDVELGRVEPILTLALQHNDSEHLVLPVIHTLERLFSHRQSAERMEKYLQSIIDRLISLTAVDNMFVRMDSLKCLSTVARQYSLVALQTFRPCVVRALSRCLGDKKRLVRREASWTRNLWLLLT